MSSHALRTQLADRLRSRSGPLPSVAIGFDAFVDEMIQLVGERQNLETFIPVATIAAFGELVGQAAGRNSLREIVVSAVHPGGCAVNMGDGLAALGVPVDAFATLGEPVHPAFNGVLGRFRSAHSWGSEPGRTLAYEFQDGKLMFSSVAQLAELTPAKVAEVLTDGAYAAACREAGIIAITNWTLYPHMTAVWRYLQSEVYAGLTHRPRFFIDLVDPTSRTPEDVRAMLATLPSFETVGPLTLGLNGNEANVLARILGVPLASGDCESVIVLAEVLRQRLEISEIVVHQIKFAVVVGVDGTASLQGPYCAQPKKSTGAGDRFNAGYALACLLDLKPAERLACASAVAGLFVRLTRSPSMDEMIDYLTSPDWIT